MPGLAVLIQGFIGFSLLAAGWFLYFKSSKNINAWFGYRTGRSMKNKEQWDFSQKYSGQTSLITGIVLILFSPVWFFLKLDGWMLFTISSIFSLAGLCYPIICTEKELKIRFPD